MKEPCVYDYLRIVGKIRNRIALFSAFTQLHTQSHVAEEDDNIIMRLTGMRQEDVFIMPHCNTMHFIETVSTAVYIKLHTVS